MQNFELVIRFVLASVLTVAPIVVACNVLRCRSWHNTEGVIDISDRLQDDDWEHGTTWSTEIEYEYTVDEFVFHSKRIGFGWGGMFLPALP